MLDHRDAVRQAVDHGYKIVYSNPFEGSDTIRKQMIAQQLQDLFLENKVLIIGGGDMDQDWPCIQYDHFLPKIHNFQENVEQCTRTEEIYSGRDKPKKFLFLNGRGRPHRKWLLEYFIDNQLIDHSIWSWLDPASRYGRGLRYDKNGSNLMLQPRPMQLLDPKYEVDRYRPQLSNIFEDSFVKYELFDNEWGEIYINANPYIDTYFSLVTETVFDYPYTFRTEKIWKPIAIGHPWICAANQYYYRDMHDLGFRTFGHLIDESWDQITDNQTRLKRLADVVRDLCQQDLNSFLQAAKDVCKYNQQHLLELRDKLPRQFPDRFFQFLKKHQWMI